MSGEERVTRGTYAALEAPAGELPDGVGLRRDFVRAKFRHRLGTDKRIVQAILEPAGFAPPAGAGGALDAAPPALTFAGDVPSSAGTAPDPAADEPAEGDA